MPESIYIVICERHPYYIPADKIEDWREFDNNPEKFNFEMPEYAKELNDTANILIKDYEINLENTSW